MSERGLGELLRALSAVPRDQWDTVSLALGFERVADTAAPTPAIVVAQDEAKPPLTWSSASPPEYAASTVSERDLPPRPVSSTVAPSNQVVPWLRVPTLSRPARQDPAAGPAPSHDPLLQPKQAPVLLSTLCSTTRPTGRIDVRVVVQQLARRRPMQRLPRRDQRTLARGIQVLADAGDGLKPFVADRAETIGALQRLIGKALVQVGWFLDDPASGVGFERELATYEPPAPGIPVLLLTDLGIGGGGTRRRWPRREHLVALARRLAAQGSPTLALVPYPPNRWPAGLDRSIALVFWDRRTTISEVRRARQRAGAVR